MNPSGPIFSSTTGNDQIDELNRILMVERELVIKTQENYRNLKKQYLDLSKEYDQLRFSNSPRGRENIQQLEEKSEQILRNMQKDCEDREIRNERFKVETLEELQNVFRKELFEQNGQIEKLRNDRNDLVKENDELLTEIMDLKTEIDDMKRREKSKEAEMRKHFDEKLKTILDETQNKVSPRLEHYNNVISQLQEQIHSLESKILEKTQEFGKCIEDKNLKLETNRKTENELKTRIYDLEFEIERLKAEKIERKNIEQSEDSQKKILNQ
ncbi:unnamed protein product [Caenorhabditis angaria]|uniref:Uncharacterized protein n=1 Tax=Caenorhabditis angaria TaxID=860376 RepID=A0A9P1IB16_9PELO|nr:unnamed protein product [Caenorhabditis angaria]